MTKTTLTPLEIHSIYVIARYGKKECFKNLTEAIVYVSHITDLVEDPASPLDQIAIVVQFVTGDEERCSYKEKTRTVQWLERFGV